MEGALQRRVCNRERGVGMGGESGCRGTLLIQSLKEGDRIVEPSDLLLICHDVRAFLIM